MCSEQHYVANYFIRSNRKRILSKEDLAYVKNWISRITEVASITSGCVVVTIVKVREVISCLKITGVKVNTTILNFAGGVVIF